VLTRAARYLKVRTPMAPRDDAWIGEVRSLVEARLTRYFDERRAALLAPEAAELIDAVARLTMRGGKRLRPALLCAAFRSACDRPLADVADACAAIELFQSYLLIHDDWMDHDDERRGGPSVHVALRDAHGGDAHLGASLAVLAGNLASAYAWELLVSSEPLRETLGIFLAMHREVVVGQELDLLGSSDIARMQQLKTGSYTVKGPLLLGAVLGGATEAQRAALEAFGLPLGEAFQLRDDLLGTFGDRSALGKPVGNDLRAGKRTALIREAEARASREELAIVREVLGRASANDAAIDRAREVLTSCGAKAAVEGRAIDLCARAKAALDGAALSEEGTLMLRGLADRLAFRDR
jgi:geranylgeranyl diphosphate synthase type I